MFSIRMKLNDVIGKDEQVILENIRRCKQFAGKGFRVIFWHENLSENDCKEFVRRNEKLLFNINSQITKMNEPCWFLIGGRGTGVNCRFSFGGGILQGLVEYIKIVSHLKEVEKK